MITIITSVILAGALFVLCLLRDLQQVGKEIDEERDL